MCMAETDNSQQYAETPPILRAVKYCGGCNPRFDRVQFVRDLEAKLGQKLSSPVPDVFYDEIYVICGCTARCADVSAFKSKKYYWIDPLKIHEGI